LIWIKAGRGPIPARLEPARDDGAGASEPTGGGRRHPARREDARVMRQPSG